MFKPLPRSFEQAVDLPCLSLPRLLLLEKRVPDGLLFLHAVDAGEEFKGALLDGAARGLAIGREADDGRPDVARRRLARLEFAGLARGPVALFKRRQHGGKSHGVAAALQEEAREPAAVGGNPRQRLIFARHPETGTAERIGRGAVLRMARPQDAAALAIYSPAGIVVHTGDFKVDYTPVFGDAIDLQRFGEIGKKGVLALMCDSTNAERPGFTMSEKTVGRTIDAIFDDNKNSRIIIATFASNVDRVQQIINAAYKNGRKVIVEGRSMVNIIGTASELGYINIPDNTLIDIEQLKNYPDEQTVIITTGSQGESMAALSRMASGIHRKVTIKPNDTIVLSSNPIPGNEKAVSNIINELSMKGAKVIFQDVHVSGHACQEEIKLIYSLVRPKYAIPVHGEYRHLIAQARVAEELGIDKDNIFILSSGDVLELDEESAAVTGKVHTGAIMVDGLGVGDVGNIVLRDRQHLAEDGIIIVVLTLEGGSGQVLAGPDIVSRGFVYVRGAETLMEEAKQVLDERMQYCMDKGITDWGKIKTEIKDSLSDFVWKETKRRPMIMPIIMEV